MDDIHQEEQRHTGPCIACLEEEVLDGGGFCTKCRPDDPRFAEVVRQLLLQEAAS